MKFLMSCHLLSMQFCYLVLGLTSNGKKPLAQLCYVMHYAFADDTRTHIFISSHIMMSGQPDLH
jgi:hypothetical protein